MRDRIAGHIRGSTSRTLRKSQKGRRVPLLGLGVAMPGPFGLNDEGRRRKTHCLILGNAANGINFP